MEKDTSNFENDWSLSFTASDGLIVEMAVCTLSDGDKVEPNRSCTANPADGDYQPLFLEILSVAPNSDSATLAEMAYGNDLRCTGLIGKDFMVHGGPTFRLYLPPDLCGITEIKSYINDQLNKSPYLWKQSY